MSSIALPVLAENGLGQYIQQANSFPMLTQEEEVELANRWVDDQDIEAAHKLVTSHLRLVVKLAQGFRGYGLPITDLISEGNIGLMHAVKRFDPDKGYRLSTYAMWWIKAAINEYILRSWSLVKMGTSASQKKLFYNLKRLKNKINAGERCLLPNEIKMIAQDLDVSERDVIEMDERLGASDASLNARIVQDEDSGQWIDYLEDASDNQEVIIAESEEMMQRRSMLNAAMECLNDRERDIIHKRQLQEDPSTLEELSRIYNVSKERIRQIEVRAMEKLQKAVLQPQG